MTGQYLYFNPICDGVYDTEVGFMTIPPEQVGELSNEDLMNMNPHDVDEYYPKEIEI